jgi:protein SCO1/2
LDLDVQKINHLQNKINNQMKLTSITILISILISLFGCNNASNIKSNENSNENNINSITDESIFNLNGIWHNQNNDSLQLKDLKGKVLVVVMIYTSCKAACPRLVADVRDIESKMPKDKLSDLNFILVSIDPDIDTPARLKKFAFENKMDAQHWTFLQGTKASVQEFANVLSVKYKEIAPMDFSHSNIISVFNTQGELIHQQEGLGVNNKETVDNITKELNGNNKEQN